MKKNKSTHTCIKILKDLCTDYPNQDIIQHISIALSDYPHVDSLSDKEFSHALEKYQLEKSLDFNSQHEDLEDIIYRGTHLFENEEEEF